jgi:hypothetical protein
MAIPMRERAFAVVAAVAVLVPTACDLLPVEEEQYEPGYVEGPVVDATTGLGIEDATSTTPMATGPRP